jgi:hypothetical protein
LISKKEGSVFVAGYVLCKKNKMQTPHHHFFFLLIFTSMLLTACGQDQQKGMAVFSGPNRFRYNLQAPEVIILPATLNEISGIAYAKDDHIFAVDDEQGTLFRLKLQQEPAVEQWQFGKKNDYEELVLTDDLFYLLSSSGTIVYFPNTLPVTAMKESKLPLKGRNEFEILFKDPAASRLLMMCKSCKNDKNGNVSVYAFDLAAKAFGDRPAATLKVKEIEDLLQENVGQFKPSGANVHPLTGEIYIVSSINQLLVITDGDFKVKEVHKLDPGIFKQPEGLCFTPSGDLLISNEAAGQGSATVLFFRKQ